MADALNTLNNGPTASSLYAAFASATAAAQVGDLAQYNNMSTKEFDAAAYSLNWTQTGCYRQGALPLALAANDTCLLGWHCKSKAEMVE
jgi:hypothetical protein